MRNEVTYEWCYETIDEFGDILENDFADRLADFSENQKTDTLCLVRREGNEVDGETSRMWAYVQDGKMLPVVFSDELGNELQGYPVPQRFQKEFLKSK